MAVFCQKPHFCFRLFFSFLTFLVLVNFSGKVSAKLLVYEGEHVLRSSDLEFPDDEPLDVIWLFRHSIKLLPKKFHLNGHAGDFVLVSEQPLYNDEYFKSISGASEDEYLDRLAESIFTDQGLLLSWCVNKTIEAFNPDGTFVLFHSELKDPSGTATFDGFEIEIEDYDASITTTTVTTPDNRLPENPEERTYISKFLDCKSPGKFVEELDMFKGNISRIATSYCKEFAVPDCLDEGEISKAEVNIPGDNQGAKYAGLHLCDTTWKNYENCVEVTFAITRTNRQGKHVLPSDQLERMWAEKSGELVEFGYCPYDPPAALIDLNTVVWVAFFLGIIISLTLLLVVAWAKNSKALIDYRKSIVDEGIGGIGKIKDTIDERQPRTTYDPNNPLYAKLARDDQLYPSGDFLHVDDTTSPGPFKKRSTDNPTFQEVETVVYAYDNNAFDQEEPQASSSSSIRSFNDNEGGRLIMRPSWDQRGSATEI